MLGVSCGSTKENTSSGVRLVTLDPGHFHAALVQKSMYSDMDSNVYVYAPAGPDLDLHLKRIEGYNTAAEKPTTWKEQVYTGQNFFEKMLEEKKGNVVVIAGNNQNKTEYIKRSIENGFNVLADKPMAIDAADFDLLKTIFTTAASKNLLLYDIMTERYEITNILQKEFAMIPEVFGILEKGTPENPAVVMESIHHFYKYVSGNVLVRPSWFFDVSQQGEGIVDVATHLVDLVQWELFPEQVIDYQKDIAILSAKRWSTDMSLSQFGLITKQASFPEFLKKDVVSDSILKVYANGEINYKLRDVHVKVIEKWNYEAPKGAGDSHYSIVRGSKANLVIRQGAEEQHKAVLYIEPVSAPDSQYESQVTSKLSAIQAKYPGVELKKNEKGWEVIVPEKYKEGHEAHFARVTEKFLGYLKSGGLPKWEVPNMLAKYYTTTRALEMARK